MAQSNEDQRFVHLLQPLRDLAQNWNIDVARDLEEYLSELESISISFDGGKTNVNFAEAALLIQGSACIYSKKVEYLYNLIYKTLDMLMSKEKQRKAKASSINAEGVDTDAMFAAQEEFLLLDDIIEAGHNVELQEADDEWAAIATAAVTDPRKTPRGPGTHQNLMAKTPLSRMGTYGALSAGSRRSVFRVAGSSLHEGSGALLLDHNNEQLLVTGADQSVSASVLHGASPVGSVARGSLFGADGWRGGLTEADRSGAEQDVHIVDGGDMYDDGMHGSFMEASPAAVGAAVASAPAARGANSRPAPSTADPWAAFDLYDEGVVQVETLDGDIKVLPTSAASGAKAPRKERPLRIARTSRAILQPAAIARYGEQVADARKHAKKMQNSGASWRESVPVHILSAVSSVAGAALQQWTPEVLPCKPNSATTASIELHAAHAAHKKALGRERLIAAAAAAAQAGLTSDEVEEGEEDLGGHWGGDEEGGMEADFLQDHGTGASCMDLLSDEVVGGGRGATAGGTDAVAAALRFEEGLPEEGDLDYESKVRGHIDAYMKEATAYATQTALSARVDAWSAKLEPLLAAQEAAPAYDIHAYGEQLVQNLALHEATPSEVLPLGRVLQRSCSTDVGRSFLALLQLANEGAVCLVHAGVDSSGQDVPTALDVLGCSVAGDCADAEADSTLSVALTQAGHCRPGAQASAAQSKEAPAAKTTAPSRGKKPRRALGELPAVNGAASPAKKLGRHVSAAAPQEALQA